MEHHSKYISNMEISLKFRVLSDENDDFIRDYEVPYKMTLLEFHNFISADLGFNNANVASFFTSDREWNRLSEYTSVDMGLGGDEIKTMDDIPLSVVVQNSNDRLIYEFDMLGGRALYLELICTAKKEKVNPSVVFSQGEPPAMFDPLDTAAGSTILEDMAKYLYGDDDI